MGEQGFRSGVELARDAAELRIRMSRLARRLRRDDQGHSLTTSQLSALRRLGHMGAATLSELAAEEGVRPQSMARTLAALEAAGMVGRAPHPTDRRQNVIRPTCAGNEVIAGNHLGGGTWLGRAMAAVLSSEERELLVRAGALMDRLADYTDPADRTDPADHADHADPADRTGGHGGAIHGGVAPWGGSAPVGGTPAVTGASGDTAGGAGPLPGPERPVGPA